MHVKASENHDWYLEPLQVMVKRFENLIVTPQDDFCEAGQEDKPTR